MNRRKFLRSLTPLIALPLGGCIFEWIMVFPWLLAEEPQENDEIERVRMKPRIGSCFSKTEIAKLERIRFVRTTKVRCLDV